MEQERKCNIDRLLRMLDNTLTRQNDKYKSAISKLTEEESSLAEHHRQIIAWLIQLNEKFAISTETFFLSMAIFDRFLVSVKAHPKYLYCIGVTCFYLAAKTVEEDNMIPDTLTLVRVSECGCSVAEVLRMERCILDKLNWDLKLATPLDFLHIYHALLLSRCPRVLDDMNLSISQHAASLVRRLQTCLLDSRLAAATPSTLALAVLSIDLEFFVGWQLWLPATVALQAVSKIAGSELIGCRELSIQLLIGKDAPTPSRNAPNPSTTIGYKPSKRKVDECVDDFYDGIKRLYAEDSATSAATSSDVVAAMTTTCAGEVLRCPHAVHDRTARVNN